MDKYICECCNGKINPRTMKCEYCDTQYKREGDDVIRIETFRNPVELFKFETCNDPVLQGIRLTGMIRVVIPKEEGRGFDSRRIME